jgi:hypothetical protein
MATSETSSRLEETPATTTSSPTEKPPPILVLLSFLITLFQLTVLLRTLELFLYVLRKVQEKCILLQAFRNIPTVTLDENRCSSARRVRKPRLAVQQT